jgi:hypothetical protein
MKTLLMLSLAAVLMSLTAVAQDDMKQAPDQTKSSAMKAVSIEGQISADGTSFVSDKDGKSWTIDNPAAVKGHEGHHVILKAQADPAKGSVHVASLKMAKETMSKDKMDNMK